MPEDAFQESRPEDAELKECWSCKTRVAIKELEYNDCMCPFCNCEIDLEDDDG